MDLEGEPGGREGHPGAVRLAGAGEAEPDAGAREELIDPNPVGLREDVIAERPARKNLEG